MVDPGVCWKVKLYLNVELLAGDPKFLFGLCFELGQSVWNEASVEGLLRDVEGMTMLMLRPWGHLRTRSVSDFG